MRYTSVVAVLAMVIFAGCSGDSRQAAVDSVPGVQAEAQAQPAPQGFEAVKLDSSAIIVDALKKLRESQPRESDIYAGLGGSDPNACDNWADAKELGVIYGWMQRHTTGGSIVESTSETVESVKEMYAKSTIAFMREQLANARKGVLETDCDGGATIFMFDDALNHLRALQLDPSEVEEGLTVQKLRGIMAKLVGLEVIAEQKNGADYAGLAKEAGEGQFHGKNWYQQYKFSCTEMGLTSEQCKKATEWPKDRG